MTASTPVGGAVSAGRRDRAGPLGYVPMPSSIVDRLRVAQGSTRAARRDRPVGADLRQLRRWASSATGSSTSTSAPARELDAYNAAFVLPELAFDVLVAAAWPRRSSRSSPACARRGDGDARPHRFGQTILTLAVLAMGVVASSCSSSRRDRGDRRARLRPAQRGAVRGPVPDHVRDARSCSRRRSPSARSSSPSGASSGYGLGAAAVQRAASSSARCSSPPASASTPRRSGAVIGARLHLGVRVVGACAATPFRIRAAAARSGPRRSASSSG